MNIFRKKFSFFIKKYLLLGITKTAELSARLFNLRMYYVITYQS
jgi:hypothetical protein